MQRNTTSHRPIVSSFLSCEKDTEIILRKLFIETRPYSDVLKRLLVVQAPDALDVQYDMSEYDLKTLIDNKYIVTTPRIEIPEHDQVKSFITLCFDEFSPNKTNPEFRDSMIFIDIVCHNDHWDLGDYRQRPFKIAGYIDGILNRTKLTGIGELLFAGMTRQTLPNEDWSVHTLSYLAVHGSDDQIPNDE